MSRSSNDQQRLERTSGAVREVAPDVREFTTDEKAALWLRFEASPRLARLQLRSRAESDGGPPSLEWSPSSLSEVLALRRQRFSVRTPARVRWMPKTLNSVNGRAPQPGSARLCSGAR